MGKLVNELDDSADWDGLLASLVGQDHGFMLEGEDARQAFLSTLATPKEYPEGTYDPRPPGRQKLSVDLSRAFTASEAGTLLKSIAAARGLRVTSRRVYSTARKWYVEAVPVCKERTYTPSISNPPAEAL